MRLDLTVFDPGTTVWGVQGNRVQETTVYAARIWVGPKGVTITYITTLLDSDGDDVPVFATQAEAEKHLRTTAYDATIAHHLHC